MRTFLKLFLLKQGFHVCLAIVAGPPAPLAGCSYRVEEGKDSREGEKREA